MRRLVAGSVIALFVPTALVAGSAAGGYPRTVVVGCAQSVYGQLASGWRSAAQGTVVAGPIAWPYVRAYSRSRKSLFAPTHGLAPAEKVLAVVDAGSSVRVTVPERERGRLSLDYTNRQPAGSGSRALYPVSSGASTVVFRPCPRSHWPGGRTQFAGGFVVNGAQCAEVDVRANRGPVLRRYIPFGVPDRGCGS